MSQAEQWRPIPIFKEGVYEVSSEGRIRRVLPKQGAQAGHVLKNQSRGNGYFTVVLWSNSKGKTFYVHELVASAFIGPRVSGHQVNHRDLNKMNNALSNLEYVTPAGNVIHASQNGAFANQKMYAARGERCARHKVTESQVRQIRKQADDGISRSAIAKTFGITRQAVWQITTGRTWQAIEGGAV
jgi:hypothetical protein